MEMYCTNCYTVARPRSFTKGSILVELMLWLLFIVPGILYSFWRLTTRYKGCPACEAPNMIPADSPKAQAMRSGG